MATPNALFAITDVSNPTGLEAKLKTLTSAVYLKLSDSDWLVYAPGSTTSKELSDQLGLSDAGSDIAVVLRVDSYFGRHYQHVWEWIRTKQGADLGTVAATAQQG